MTVHVPPCPTEAEHIGMQVRESGYCSLTDFLEEFYRDREAEERAALSDIYASIDQARESVRAQVYRDDEEIEELERRFLDGDR